MKNLDISQNKLQIISAPFKSAALENLNLMKNEIKSISEDTFTELTSLKVLDLRENKITSFSSFPKSSKLETVQLSFNQLTELRGFVNAPNIATLDVKNNKIVTLTDEIFVLKDMKILDISNNEMQSLPNELGIMKNLNKIIIDGNPLRSIRVQIRQGGTEVIKSYLASRITEADIEKKEPNSKQGFAMGQSGIIGGHATPSHHHKGPGIGPQHVQETAPAQAKDFSNLKKELIKEEFHEKPANNLSKLAQFVRKHKNTNGDLDLRSKDLSNEDITEDVLLAGNCPILDMSGNKFTDVPQFVDQLNSSQFKLNNNQIAKVEVNQIINFTTLRELEFKQNKMTAFCEEQLIPQDILLLQMNFKNLSRLDLSQNQLTKVSSVFKEFKNLKNLNLSFNNITSIDELFQEGALQVLDTLDISNNNLTTLPHNVYKWQTITILVVQNNNIKSFPHELGFMNLKSFNVTGNPTMLVKGTMANKGVGGLLQYLKDRCTNAPAIEKEIEQINNQRKEGQASNLPPTKPHDLDEYQYTDPFKKKADAHMAKEHEKHGEVYEEDVRKELQKVKTQNNEGIIDEKKQSAKASAHPQTHNKNAESSEPSESQSHGRVRFTNPGKADVKVEPGKSRPDHNIFGTAPVQYKEKPTEHQEEPQGMVFSNEKKAKESTVKAQESSVSTQAEPKAAASADNTSKIAELDAQIKQLQDKVDNDYTLSKPMIISARKELGVLRAQRNGLAANSK